MSPGAPRKAGKAGKAGTAGTAGKPRRGSKAKKAAAPTPPRRTAKARSAPARAARSRAAKPTQAKAMAALDASLTEAVVIERNGYPYLVHPLLDGVPRCPPELVQAWVGWARRSPLCGRASLLLAPEAMALPLVTPLALALGIPYAVVRKRRYDLPGELVAYAETGYGGSALHINGVGFLDRVLVIDNVLSTGGTLGSILATLQETGCTVVGALVALDKGDAREGLQERYNVPVVCMRTIAIEDGQVRIVKD